MNKIKIFFKIVGNEDGKFSWNDKVIDSIQVDNKIKIDNKEFNLSPEIQKAMIKTDYNFKNMKNDGDMINFCYDILKTVDYNYKQDSHSTRSKYIKNNLQNRVDRILNPIISSSLPTTIISQIFITTQSDSEDSDDLRRKSGVSKIIIPSNIIEIWTRLELLLGLETYQVIQIPLTEASSLLDELYKGGEIQTEQQYKNALNKSIQ